MARIQLVAFEIDGKEFGIEATVVSGILRARKFTIQKIPSLPDVIEGVINLRGKVSYIFNLRNKLKLENKPVNEESKIIMVCVGDSVVGCIVDEVTDIVTFNEEDIETAPFFIKGAEGQYIAGIGKVDDRLIIILKAEKLLADTEVVEMSTEH